MTGHLFVVRGDLTRLAVDAVLVPSGWKDGRLGHVGSRAWDELLSDHLDAERFVRPAPDEDQRVCEVRRLVDGPAVWVGHTGDDDREPRWYGEAAGRFVEAAGRAGSVLAFRPLDHERPLLALPLLGVGLGGMAERKGEVVVAYVRSIVATMAHVDADVVLVLADDQAFAAALQARQRVLGDSGWAGLEPHREAAADLARRARAKQLVLFVGSGASMGAGGLSWKGLLRALGAQAGWDEPQLTELVDHLDARDAGQVLTGWFGAAELRRRVVALTTVERPSLVHQLLASLPVEQAVTTNYDDGLELSFAAAGHALPVLPQAEATRWLLKLHGSVSRPESIVLSRDDYLRWEEHGAAFGAVVQALLLTRHLLFVGYGLGDDNMHRLMHGVRAALGGREQRVGESKLATVVAAAPESLADRVWEEDLRFVRMATGPQSRRARCGSLSRPRGVPDRGAGGASPRSELRLHVRGRRAGVRPGAARSGHRRPASRRPTGAPSRRSAPPSSTARTGAATAPLTAPTWADPVCRSIASESRWVVAVGTVVTPADGLAS